MTAVFKLSVDQPSPFSHISPPTSGGGSLIFGSDALILAVYLSAPTQAELDVLGRGRVDVAVLNEGTSGVMVYRFAGCRSEQLFIETPFHAGLEGTARVPHFDVSSLEPEASCIMFMVLQDDKNIVRLIRPLVLPYAICETASGLVAQQMAEARSKRFKLAHTKRLRRYQRRYTSPEAAYRAARLRSQIGTEQNNQAT